MNRAESLGIGNVHIGATFVHEELDEIETTEGRGQVERASAPDPIDGVDVGALDRDALADLRRDDGGVDAHHLHIDAVVAERLLKLAGALPQQVLVPVHRERLGFVEDGHARRLVGGEFRCFGIRGRFGQHGGWICHRRSVGRVVVVMEHTNKAGESKVLPKCTLPLTGKGVVNRIITDLAVLDVTHEGLKLVELADGVTREEVVAATGAPLVD